MQKTMPKGQAPKLHGAIVNVPVDINRTNSLLPNTENIIMVKLKKFNFWGSYWFWAGLSWKDLWGTNLFKI